MDWSLEPIFGSYLFVASVGIALIVLLFLNRESAKLTRVQRFVLWSLRFLLCLLILLFMLRPGITFTQQKTPQGSIAVMMDASSSMQLASGEGNKSRWEVERSIWEALWQQRELLGQDSQLVPFLYDSKLRSLGEGPGGLLGNAAPSLPERAEGTTTDIGGPLNQLMSAPLSSPLTALVWMGDGAQTHSPLGADAQQMARQLARLDVPMYVIGVGPRSDSDAARDLSIESLPEQLDVYTKNPVKIQGILKSRGAANRDVPIKLFIIPTGGKPKLVDQTIVRPTKSQQSLSFSVPLIAPDAGSYQLLVQADPLDGEAITENNEGTVFLNVRSGGARILYLEGEARFESQFLTRAFADSPDLKLESQWIPKPPAQKWPVDLSQQLADGVYDCFVIGDLDYDAIGMAGARSIAEQVNKGAGLITLGGYHAYGAGGWDQSPLRDILPIDMSGQQRQRLDTPIQLRNHLMGPIAIVPRGNHPLLQVAAPELNEQVWKQLKPMPGANKWNNIKNTTGTNVIAESASGDPLIVVGSAGQGRIVSLAIDETYQWLRQGKGNEYKQFWRQIMLWCLRREKIEEGMQLKMVQRRLLLDQSAEMQLMWSGGSDVVEMPKGIALHLWRTADPRSANPDERDEDLGEVTLAKRDATSMRAQFAATKVSGRYEWRATVTGSKGQSLEAKLPFVVIDSSIESTQPLPDWPLIEQLAKLNESAGGALVVPEQTDDIIRQILERRKAATQTAIENRKLGDGTLDTWLVYLSIAGVLLLQWGLRKRWSLP